MVRSRKPDLVDWIRIFSRIPPTVTLPLAVGGYLVCHHFAAVAVVPGSGPVAPADAAAFSIVRVLALVFQYLLPFSLAMSAVLWGAGFIERQRLRRLAQASSSPEVLAGLSWSEFEKVVAQGFSTHGLSAQLTAEGGDGGIDIVLERQGQRYLVQAKHWRAASVGVDVVRALYGVVCADGASGGYVVTSGEFTKAASDFAAGKPIWLVSGQRLRDLLAAGRASDPGRLVLDRLPTPASESDVPCPLCERPMVLREARQGVHQGKRFFGCSGFPGCSGIRAVD